MSKPAASDQSTRAMPATAQAQLRPSPPSRDLVDQFRNRLDTALKKSAAKSAPVSEKPGQTGDSGSAGTVARAGRKPLRDEELVAARPDAAMAHGGAIASASEAPVAAPHTPLISTEMQAQIDRMAAAIAEAQGRADGPVFSIEFSAGAGALAQGAVVSRTEAGAFHIRLVPTDGVISPQVWAVARQALSLRLQQRRITVAEISLEGADAPLPDQAVTRKR